MSDTIYAYYDVPLTKELAIGLEYLPGSYLSKLDYVCNIKGRVCVQIKRPPKNSPGKQTYEVSYSFCSPEDNFNRKIARKIASGRGRVEIQSDKPLKVNEVSKTAIDLLFDASKVNSRGFRQFESYTLPKWLTETQRDRISLEYRPRRYKKAK